MTRKLQKIFIENELEIFKYSLSTDRLAIIIIVILIFTFQWINYHDAYNKTINTETNNREDILAEIDELVVDIDELIVGRDELKDLPILIKNTIYESLEPESFVVFWKDKYYYKNLFLILCSCVIPTIMTYNISFLFFQVYMRRNDTDIVSDRAFNQSHLIIPYTLVLATMYGFYLGRTIGYLLPILLAIWLMIFFLFVLTWMSTFQSGKIKDKVIKQENKHEKHLKEQANKQDNYLAEKVKVLEQKFNEITDKG